MDRKYLETYTQPCLYGSLAPCSGSCPLNLDIRKIADYIQKGNFSMAYKQYRDKSVFPGIVCRVCGEPCKTSCVRKEKDEPVSLRSLERACVDYADSDTPSRFNLPKRKTKIAIIGGGLAGLTCAQRLGMKSYDITIYEKAEFLGGRLHSMLPAEEFMPEIEGQLRFTKCNFQMNTEIKSLDELDFDAAIIATGAGGQDFGLMAGYDTQSFASSRPGVFIVGAVIGAAPVTDIAQASVAAHSVEKYIQLKKTDGIPESFIKSGSCIKKDLSALESAPAVVPADGKLFARDEAISEANRCLKCDCTECRDCCELLENFQKTPQLMAKDALAALHSQGARLPAKQSATRVTTACNLCGLCGDLCPEDISLGKIAHDYRHFKFEDNCYPAKYSDFFLRDMAFSNNEAFLCHAAPGHEKASYLFFPGCQLGGSDPRYVTASYSALLKKLPDTAIYLGCCGVSADWAGNTPLHRQVQEDIKQAWETLGKPKFIFACATCRKQFYDFLPEIEQISLYELLDESGISVQKNYANEMSVFDPCASRDFPDMQKTVRKIVKESGINNHELRFSNERARCCGWGGHVMGANMPFADKIIGNRISEYSHPYVTYCSNCRDVFSSRGKECVHVLDLIFGLNDVSYQPPSWSDKRKNKVYLKKTLLEDIFCEGPQPKEEERFPMKLTIPEDVMAMLNHDLILEDEIRETISHIEKTGESVYNKLKDTYIGYCKIGIVTFWVEYQKKGDEFILHNAYTHRMVIDTTEVIR